MPNRPHAYCVLALSYFEVGRYEDTLAAAQMVNELQPGCGGEQLFFVQAHSYYALERYEEGIAFINTTFDNLGI
jgi:tetratricopeptide (TPR) repeat protein